MDALVPNVWPNLVGGDIREVETDSHANIQYIAFPTSFHIRVLGR